MKRHNRAVGILVMCMFALFGCGSSNSSTSSSGSERDASTRRSADQDRFEQSMTSVPAGSPFAQLRYGMGTKEVIDLLGPPTDSDGHITGKAFNPFYYGTDTHRTKMFYKGQGRLIFNSRGRLLEIQPNADERGYR